MSFDLNLKPSCGGCGSTSELYGSNCKHLTLCLSCGKTMAENSAKCYECGITITKLIREYNVRASTGTDKTFYIGRFVTGLPPFSKKKSAENKWTLQKEGLQGRQLTDGLREKYKNKPWILEDETGQYQYQGHLEGAQSAAYYLLMMQGKEFVAIPSGSWYNFNKIAQYKQLTLEEAEEKMNKRKSNATGYERWMMKAATNGAAAFGEIKKNEGPSGSGADVSHPRKGKDDDDGDVSNRVEDGEDEVAEEARKNRLALNKKSGDGDEEESRERDFDLDDDDIEKGDDWEHEEVFTDDDEAVGNDREEREDLAPEIPAPPEIKQDENDHSEEEGGLSKSGKELQKLLGRSGGLNESDAEDGEDDEDVEDETDLSPVLAPKQKDVTKDEPSDSPLKTVPALAKGTPSSKAAKSKRKPVVDDVKNGASNKRVKTDNDSRLPVKNEQTFTPKSTLASKASGSVSVKSVNASSAGPVPEEEIRNVLLAMGPIKTQDLVAKFKPRLQEKADKDAFADILKRISKIQKINGASYVVLKER